MVIDLNTLNLRNNLVLIRKKVHEEEKTSGGIIVPTKKLDIIQDGKVLAIGPGKITKNGKTIKMTVDVGTIVKYNINDIHDRIINYLEKDDDGIETERECIIIPENKLLCLVKE